MLCSGSRCVLAPGTSIGDSSSLHDRLHARDANERRQWSIRQGAGLERVNVALPVARPMSCWTTLQARRVEPIAAYRHSHARKNGPPCTTAVVVHTLDGVPV